MGQKLIFNLIKFKAYDNGSKNFQKYTQICHSCRFFSTNLGASRFPDATCENPEFLFSFEIGKTKGRLTLLHGPCLQTHKVWAKNKCYDRLNPLHTATQRMK